MKSQDPENSVVRTRPTALSEALRGRLLAAMNNAAEEERSERDLEAQLRHLSPAPLSPRLAARVGVRMCLKAADVRTEQHHCTYRRPLWQPWAAAAVLALFCVGGGLSLFTGSAAADTAQGLASRSVLESHSGDAVQWQEDGGAVRSYEVLYEDSFVMEAGDGMKVMVRVPNRAQVQVEEEVL